MVTKTREYVEIFGGTVFGIAVLSEAEFKFLNGKAGDPSAEEFGKRLQAKYGTDFHTLFPRFDEEDSPSALKTQEEVERRCKSLLDDCGIVRVMMSKTHFKSCIGLCNTKDHVLEAYTRFMKCMQRLGDVDIECVLPADFYLQFGDNDEVGFYKQALGVLNKNPHIPYVRISCGDATHPYTLSAPPPPPKSESLIKELVLLPLTPGGSEDGRTQVRLPLHVSRQISLGRHSSEHPSPWGIKDPRVSRCHATLRAEPPSMACIVAVGSNPVKVIHSGDASTTMLNKSQECTLKPGDKIYLVVEEEVGGSCRSFEWSGNPCAYLVSIVDSSASKLGPSLSIGHPAVVDELVKSSKRSIHVVSETLDSVAAEYKRACTGWEKALSEAKAENTRLNGQICLMREQATSDAKLLRDQTSAAASSAIRARDYLELMQGLSAVTTSAIQKCIHEHTRYRCGDKPQLLNQAAGCTVCFDAVAEWACVPCGHLVACHACKDAAVIWQSSKCPICTEFRFPAEHGLLRVYTSGIVVEDASASASELVTESATELID